MCHIRTWYPTLSRFSNCQRALTLAASLIRLTAAVGKVHREIRVGIDARSLWYQWLTSAVLSMQKHPRNLLQKLKAAQSGNHILRKWIWHLNNTCSPLLHKSKHHKNIPADILLALAIPAFFRCGSNVTKLFRSSTVTSLGSTSAMKEG